MIELVFVACLQMAPDSCEERRLPDFLAHDLFGCMIQAQFRLAEWSEENPHTRITRWACRRLAPGEREA